MTIRLC